MGKKNSVVRINYKSGHSEEFPVMEFTFTVDGNNDRKATWQPVDGGQRPIFMNLDEIESIWQVQ